MDVGKNKGGNQFIYCLLCYMSPETCLVFVPIEFDLATFKTDEIVPDEKFGKEQLIQFFSNTLYCCNLQECRILR